MNNLLNITTNQLTISSREIAELTEKEHNLVIRDIKTMLINLYGLEYVKKNIPEHYRNRNSEYIRNNADSILQKIIEKFDGSNWIHPERQGFTWKRDNRGYISIFHLDKEHALCLASGYSVQLRMKIIKRWKELESNQPKLPTNYLEALEHLTAQVKVNLELNNKLEQAKPKLSYYDTILQSKSLVTISQIAKDYGLSGKAMNETLAKLQIQYKQNGQWLLYSHYQNKGYVSSKTIAITRSLGNTDVVMITEWTQQGRLFLYELLKKHNILPLIEQNNKLLKQA